MHVGERGQLQAVRTDRTDAPGIYFPADSTSGDAGFFLAFPGASPPALAATVYGFTGTAGPMLSAYTPLTHGGVTGSGALVARSRK